MASGVGKYTSLELILLQYKPIHISSLPVNPFPDHLFTAKLVPLAVAGLFRFSPFATFLGRRMIMKSTTILFPVDGDDLNP
jgi:hypothetical protein